MAHALLTHILMMRWIIAFALFMLVFLPGHQAKATTDYSNCTSKDVYDAGYILRLSPDDLLAAYGPVATEVYQYVMLWTPKKIFAGGLNLSRTFVNGVCRLSLTDVARPPAIQIQFAVKQGQLSGRVRRIAGTDTRKFSEIVCDLDLQATLKELCK
jgi:hypothetical protein